MSSTAASSDQPMDPKGATGVLCNWIHGLTLQDIPSDVQERAKYLILDGIACALVGAHLPWSEKAANAIFDMEPAGDCTIFGWNGANEPESKAKKVSPIAAALLNSTFIQGFELDDWHSEAPLHSNSIILPALFAAAEHLNRPSSSGSCKIDGPSFLLAYLVGLEVGPRVGNGLYGADMLTRGWHSGAVFGPAASSTAVSKMMKLTANQIEDALGIACTQAGGLMSAQFESEVKRMQHGFAARNGLLGAMLARGGYIGIKKVLERPYGGYLSMFGQGSGKTPPFRVDEITKGLGSLWKTWGVRLKPYAAMAGTHSSIDCIRNLQAEYPEQMKDLDSIASIKLQMSEVAYHHGGWKAERPLTSTGAQMSNAYVAATQLVDGQVLPAQFRYDKLENNQVWELVDKTTCELTKEFALFAMSRATVTFKDGKAVSALVPAARGVIPPLTNEEIVEKWTGITKDVIDEERTTRIETLCRNFESMEDITELIDLLAGVTQNPIA